MAVLPERRLTNSSVAGLAASAAQPGPPVSIKNIRGRTTLVIEVRADDEAIGRPDRTCAFRHEKHADAGGNSPCHGQHAEGRSDVDRFDLVIDVDGKSGLGGFFTHRSDATTKA